MTFVAPAAAVPVFFTVADTVTGSVSTGVVGDHEEEVSVRSGFGAGTPMTWNSATCPPGAPVLEVMESSTSATRALTGMVTVLPVAGLNVYACAAAMVDRVVADCSRPRTAMVWVRVPHEASGFSLTTTEDTSAFAPSCTVAWVGYVEPSKYVLTSLSLALPTRNVNVDGVPEIGLPTARFTPVPPPPDPVRVTVFEAADWFPAASCAFT